MAGSVHIRVDSRLLHGQVVQFWIGHLEIAYLVIADNEIAQNKAMAAIYRMALPELVNLKVIPVHSLSAELVRPEPPATMVLIRGVHDAVQTIMDGVSIDMLTLGNVHAAPDRARVTDSVYLSNEEVSELIGLTLQGVGVEIQTFPGEILRLSLDETGGAIWSRP